MIRISSRSHASILEKFRIALDKVEYNPGIRMEMKKIGYGTEVLTEGRALLESTRKIFDENLKLKDELSIVRTEYTQLRVQIDQIFREHRNKALLIFRSEPKYIKSLRIKGKYPSEEFKWEEMIRSFYRKIVEDPKMQQRFQRLNLSTEEAEAGLERIRKLEILRARRAMAKGESKDSTVQKNKAFKKINLWMSDFYGAARLALKKKPELLEALYKSA